MTRAGLRTAISRPGAFDAITAAGDLGDVLSEKVADHIRDVYQRLELVAGDEPALAAPLRLAVLLHEELPDRLPALLERVGSSDLATIVTAVIGAFGRLWKLQGDDDAADYVSSHRVHLEPLLLFELAHEGAPTSRMRRIARLGGVERDFERWVRRLQV